MRVLVLSIVIAAGCASGALASSSAWHKTEGARLRILTSGAPDAEGRLKGALQIDLKPGWKTYWRDPGGSGVPPAIDISMSTNIASLDIAYPAPMRFDDESGPWIGYKHSVVFPVTFQLSAADQPAKIAAEVFIGVCETICIPFQASLSFDPAGDPDNADDAAVIAAATGALPAAAAADFGATLLSADGDGIRVAVSFPGDPQHVDLFVAGVDGYTLGTPEKHVAEGRTVFAVAVLERPASKPAGKGLPYTLVTQAGAVEGFLPYP
jgi:DsbC/DsbD-like thiol-disulfide interchange protein